VFPVEEITLQPGETREMPFFVEAPRSAYQRGTLRVFMHWKLPREVIEKELTLVGPF